MVWTLVATGGSVAAAIVLAPAASAHPGAALSGLLFVGSSMHVAASGWFVRPAAVRSHARAEPARYLGAPVLLVAAGAAVAASVSSRRLDWLLLAFFGWQFFHFQKQNLGIAALAGAGQGAPGLRPRERAAVVAIGVAGIAGLLCHPELLQLTVRPPVRAGFVAAAVVGAAGAAWGALEWTRRSPDERPWPFTAAYATALLFFVPVFALRSPYAAVAGLTIAHGVQYLLLMGLVAGGEPAAEERLLSWGVLANVALLGGVALNWASHRHGGAPADRAIFGAYLGVVMAHFVVDAGLWRLRHEFPRAFLRARIPALLGSGAGYVQAPPQLPAAPERANADEAK